MDQAERNLVKHRRPRAYESEVSLERLLVSLLEVLALAQHVLEVKVHTLLMWRSKLELNSRCAIDWLQPTLKHNRPSSYAWVVKVTRCGWKSSSWPVAPGLL